MSRRGRPWSWRRRLAYLSARFWKKKRAEIEQHAHETVHVRPCIDCGSTQLCEPDCRLAPWNLEET